MRQIQLPMLQHYAKSLLEDAHGGHRGQLCQAWTPQLCVWTTALTFSRSHFITATALSPVFKLVSVPMSVPLPFVCPQQVVVPGLAWTLHIHSHSVSVPAWAWLQPHRAQALQAFPIILRPGQRVKGSVLEDPCPTFGCTGPLGPMPAALPDEVVTLWDLQRVLQRVLQGVAAPCWGLSLPPLALRSSSLGAVRQDQGSKQERQKETPGESHRGYSTALPAGMRTHITELLTSHLSGKSWHTDQINYK